MGRKRTIESQIEKVRRTHNQDLFEKVLLAVMVSGAPYTYTKTRRARRPHAWTIEKINKLLCARRKWISEGKELNHVTHAIQLAGLDYRTVQRHAPEVIDNWYDMKWDTTLK